MTLYESGIYKDFVRSIAIVKRAAAAKDIWDIRDKVLEVASKAGLNGPEAEFVARMYQSAANMYYANTGVMPKEWFEENKLEIENEAKNYLGKKAGRDTFEHAAAMYRNKRGILEFVDFVKGGEVYPVYLKMENPLIVDLSGKRYNTYIWQDIINKATKDGYDGVILKGVTDVADNLYYFSNDTEYIVFEPNQIKSVYNRGTFDVNDDNIYHQGPVKENNNVVDLTNEFSNLLNLSPEDRATAVENELNRLIKKGGIDTATPPLQIQITKGNKKHIKKPNIKLKGNKLKRHQSAITALEKIINISEKINRNGTVDLTHNTSKKTLEHKKKVEKYVYFETEIKLGQNDFYKVEFTTEKIKGQDPNLLNLYNIKIERSIAATPKGISQSNASTNSINNNGQDVNTADDTLNQGPNVNFEDIKASEEYKKLENELDNDKEIESDFDGYEYGTMEFIKKFAPDNSKKVIQEVYEEKKEAYFDNQYKILSGKDIEAKRDILEEEGWGVDDLLELYNGNNGTNLTEEELLALDLSKYVSEDLPDDVGFYKDIDYQYSVFMVNQYMDVLAERISYIEDYIKEVLPKYGYEYLYTDTSRISESTYIYFKPTNSEEEYNIRLASHFDRHPSSDRLSVDIKDNAEKIAKNIDTYLKNPEDDKTRRDIYFQRAYHGTPHRFDKFSSEAIGTGEGAQVHGWGLYFTSKGVAEGYRKRLSGGISFNGVSYSDNMPIAKALTLVLNEGKTKALEVLGKVKEVIKSGAETHLSNIWGKLEDLEKIIDTVKSVKRKSDIKKIALGQLFEVEIPENDVLLDEQKPFSKQPEKVKEAILKIFKDNGKNFEDIIKDKYGETEPIGRNIYNEIRDSLAEGKPKQASLLLNEYGIKGITYEGGLDGRSFVVFDDKAIEVIETFFQGEKRDIEEPRARVSFTPQGVFMQLLENADPSSIVHETAGHVLLRNIENIKGLAELKGTATTEFMQVWADLEAWLGKAELTEDENGKPVYRFSREQQEMFAEGMEKMFAAGKAPTKMLEKVFAYFKNMLRDLFEDAREFLNLRPEVENLFERILALEEIEKADSKVYKGKGKDIKEIAQKAREGKAATINGIGIKEVKALLKQLNRRRPGEPKEDLLKTLKRSGADFDNSNIVDTEVYQNAGIRNDKNGVGDKLADYLAAHGYMTEADGNLSYEELSKREEAADLIQRDLAEEKIYRLFSKAIAY